jgi:hypothetical protein
VVIKTPCNRQLTQLPFWWLGLFSGLSKERFDAIYCSNDWYGFLPYYLFSRIFNCPIIFEAHGILSEEYTELGRRNLSKIYSYWEKFVIIHSKKVIALSKGIFNFYVRYNDNCVLIPVFIDLQKYKLDAKKRKTFREQYGLTGYKVIGLIGPFDTEWNKYSLKFLLTNLRAFDERIKFMIIGKCDVIKKHERLIFSGYVKDYPGILSALDSVFISIRHINFGTSK